MFRLLFRIVNERGDNLDVLFISGLLKLSNCSLQQREFNFWLTAHEHSYMTWCKAESLQSRNVISVPQQCFHGPPAGIRKTILYVSCAFTDSHNTHHSRIIGKRKQFRELIIKSPGHCRLAAWSGPWPKVEG